MIWVGVGWELGWNWLGFWLVAVLSTTCEVSLSSAIKKQGGANFPCIIICCDSVIYSSTIYVIYSVVRILIVSYTQQQF